MKLSEPIRDSGAAVTLLRKAIPRGRIGLQECLVALFLDSQFRAVGRAVLVAMGTANNVEVTPRDIFREAIRRNSIAVIVCHNHPTGNLAPSQMDKDLTVRLDNAGKLLGIQVLDHIIVGRENHLSMTDGTWG
jgi:DNA repair protein RadC